MKGGGKKEFAVPEERKAEDQRSDVLNLGILLGPDGALTFWGGGLQLEF